MVADDKIKLTSS